MSGKHSSKYHWLGYFICCDKIIPKVFINQEDSLAPCAICGKESTVSPERKPPPFASVMAPKDRTTEEYQDWEAELEGLQYSVQTMLELLSIEKDTNAMPYIHSLYLVASAEWAELLHLWQLKCERSDQFPKDDKKAMKEAEKSLHVEINKLHNHLTEDWKEEYSKGTQVPITQRSAIVIGYFLKITEREKAKALGTTPNLEKHCKHNRSCKMFP
jgi:hypothetical protein